MRRAWPGDPLTPWSHFSRGSLFTRCPLSRAWQWFSPAEPARYEGDGAPKSANLWFRDPLQDHGGRLSARHKPGHDGVWLDTPITECRLARAWHRDGRALRVELGGKASPAMTALRGEGRTSLRRFAVGASTSWNGPRCRAPWRACRVAP